jgi:tRNA uridine 5-carbamoylmethylation protein Kti12
MDDVASISTRASRLDAAAPRVISFSGTDASPSSSYSSMQGFQSVDQTLPAVLHYLQGAAAPVPNSSTITLQRATPALLYELDRVSQTVIERLVAHQAEAAVVVGTPLKFHEYDRAITLTHHVSQAELQRYRRQYVKVNGSHPPLSSQAIGTSFIDYLALHI